VGPLVGIFFILSSPFLLFSTVLVWPAGHHCSTPRPSLLHGPCSTGDPTCYMDVARARFRRRGGRLSSIPPQRISPKLDSPERMPPLGRAGGGAKHLHQGPPPSTSSCSIGAGAGGELHRGLQSFVSPRPLLHPASVLGSSAGAAAGELHPWGLLPSRRQASRRLTTRSPSGPRPEAPATPRGAASKLSDPRATTGHCASHIRQPPPSYSYRTRSPHCTHEKMRNGDERRKKMLTGGARMSLRG
jgi:hypothetical protein